MNTFATSITLWKRSIVQGVYQLIRERNWLIAIGALSGIFLLVQLLMVAFVGLRGFEAVMQGETSIRIEVTNGARQEKIAEFVAGTKALSYVSYVQRITPEQSYELMKKNDPNLISFLEEFNLENPFPETIQIGLQSLLNYADLQDFISQDAWRELIDPTYSTNITDQEAYMNQVIHITRAIRNALLVFIGVAAAILLYITIELIRSRVIKRSEEVLIKRLCGAIHFYILLPFVVEAVLLLFIAFCISVIIMIASIFGIQSFIPNVGPEGVLNKIWQASQVAFMHYGLLVIGIQILLIPVLSWLGTWFGSYQILRTQNYGLHRH
jgi:cell division transport system permease protein